MHFSSYDKVENRDYVVEILMLDDNLGIFIQKSAFVNE